MRIKIEGDEIGRNMQRARKMMIKPEAILRYLISDDDRMDTLIMCQGEHLNLITNDYYLYEAMGSIKPYDDFKLNKLVKFFQVVEVQSYGRKKEILKEERVEELRKLALKDKEGEEKDTNEKDNGGTLK